MEKEKVDLGGGRGSQSFMVAGVFNLKLFFLLSLDLAGIEAKIRS
jgi:hypothetical protein